MALSNFSYTFVYHHCHKKFEIKYHLDKMSFMKTMIYVVLVVKAIGHGMPNPPGAHVTNLTHNLHTQIVKAGNKLLFFFWPSPIVESVAFRT